MTSRRSEGCAAATWRAWPPARGPIRLALAVLVAAATGALCLAPWLAFADASHDQAPKLVCPRDRDRTDYDAVRSSGDALARVCAALLTLFTQFAAGLLATPCFRSDRCRRDDAAGTRLYSHPCSGRFWARRRPTAWPAARYLLRLGRKPSNLSFPSSAWEREVRSSASASGPTDETLTRSRASRRCVPKPELGRGRGSASESHATQDRIPAPHHPLDGAERLRHHPRHRVRLFSSPGQRPVGFQ